MSSSAPPMSVLYFNYAVIYHVQELQKITDSNIIVRFPVSIYNDFQAYVDGKGEIKASRESNKAKIMTADTSASEFINKLFDVIGDRVTYLGEKYNSLAEFVKEDSAAAVMNEFKDDELESDFLLPGVKDVIKHLETSYEAKALSNKKKSIPKDLVKGIFNGYIKMLFAAAKSVAAAVIFSTARTTSKYTLENVRAALLTICTSEFKDDIYKLFIFCGREIVKKDIYTTTPKKPAGEAAKKTTTGTKSKPQSTRENVSDDEDEDKEKDNKDKKKSRPKKPAKPTVDDDSDEDSSGSDSSDSEVEGN